MMKSIVSLNSDKLHMCNKLEKGDSILMISLNCVDLAPSLKHPGTHTYGDWLE